VSNKNYDQVTDLLAQGKLRWDIDAIAAVLVKDGAYDPAHKRLTDVGAVFQTSAPIQGRWIGENGAAMGLPAIFNKVAGGQEYQVLVVQEDGGINPVLLAYMDEDAEGDVITIQRTGSLIVRPQQGVVQPLIEPVQTPPPTTGVWMTLA
jgi:hypothetical protein